MTKGKSIKARAREALAFARERAQQASSWVELHNLLFGLFGKCTELFGSASERTAFTKTPEYQEIQELLAELRERLGDPAGVPAGKLASANGRILVRLPRTLHAALLAEAEAEGVSLNQLCLAKLAVQLQARIG